MSLSDARDRREVGLRIGGKFVWGIQVVDGDAWRLWFRTVVRRLGIAGGVVGKNDIEEALNHVEKTY